MGLCLCALGGILFQPNASQRAYAQTISSGTMSDIAGIQRSVDSTPEISRESGPTFTCEQADSRYFLTSGMCAATKVSAPSVLIALRESQPQASDSSASSSNAKGKKKKKPKRGTIVLAPLPIVSPAIGTGLIPFVGYIFPFSKKDKVSPPSTVGVAGLITNNGSRAFIVGGDLYLNQNRYDVTAVFGRGNLDYNLYGVGIGEGSKDLKLPLVQTGNVVLLEFSRRVLWSVFLGVRFWDGRSFITLGAYNPSLPIPPIPPDVGISTQLVALGPRLQRDTRPNRFYPTSGTYLVFTGDFFATGLGSKYSYQSYKINFSQYLSLNSRQVLAYNLYFCNTGGSPPFYGNCAYGTSNQLRGYTAGQYLDRHMYTAQAEYRLTLPKGFGLAGFAGLGGVAPGPTQLLRSSSFLPDIGGGPRYELSKQYHLNLRADFARGKGSWTWSLGVGEAF
jgi:hypothetical protein